MAWQNGIERRRGARQQWDIGNIVAVGFVRDLRIVGKETETTRDGRRIIYRLRRESNGVAYTFTPHEGLSRDE